MWFKSVVLPLPRNPVRLDKAAYIDVKEKSSGETKRKKIGECQYQRGRGIVG
jgi:hypothetical protein